MVNLFKILSSTFGSEVLFVEEASEKEDKHTFVLYQYTGKENGVLVTPEGYSELWGKPANVDTKSYNVGFEYDNLEFGGISYGRVVVPSYKDQLTKLVQAGVITSFSYDKERHTMSFEVNQSQYDRLAKDEGSIKRQLGVDEYIQYKGLGNSVVRNPSSIGSELDVLAQGVVV